MHRLIEASKTIEVGLKAEPARPELKLLQARVQKDLERAEDYYKAAERMRRFEKGVVHALSALDDGLRRCADHPKLRELRNEMRDVLEERTAPPVTAAFIAAARTAASAPALEEGRRLYTTRCTECHELELLDSRTVAAWREAVAGMSRRAKIDGTQQARIVEYIAAAQRTLQ